jgi:hypothetical protein
MPGHVAINQGLLLVVSFMTRHRRGPAVRNSQSLGRKPAGAANGLIGPPLSTERRA